MNITNRMLDTMGDNPLVPIVRSQRKYINQLTTSLQMAERRERDGAVEITRLKRLIAEFQSKGVMSVDA